MIDQFDKIIQQFKDQLATIQAGRATPTLIERTIIDVYNSKLPLLQVSSITNLDNQTLQVQPWDATMIKPIEKALYANVTNVTVTIDGANLKVHFPPLTMEKRQALVKVMKQQAADAHITVKRLREDLLNHLKQSKKDNSLSEDAVFAEQKKIQKLVDQCNASVDQLAADKEKVLLTI